MEPLDKSLTKETLKMYWKFTKQQWPMASFAFGAMLATGILQAYQPFLYKRLLDLLVYANGAQVRAAGIRIIVLIAITGLCIITLRRLQDWGAIRFQPKVKESLLRYCFEYLHKHSVNFFNDNFAGTLVRRVNRYDRSYEDLSDQIIFNLGQTFVRVGLIIVASSFRSWKFSAFIFAWVAVYMSINYVTARYRLRYDLAVAEQDSTVTGFLADTIGNELNIKLFSALGIEKGTFAKLVAEQQRRLRKAWEVALRSDFIQTFLMVVLEIGVVTTTFLLWQRGQLTIGDFALAQSYVAQINGRLWDFGRNVRNIYRALADANEMTEILLTPHEVMDAPNAKKLSVANGEIHFTDVTFSYNGKSEVFTNFNFPITAGERVALVGPSGGGKSTIVKLLLRYSDIESGQITIDGQNIATVTQDSLRQAIALVPQDPILFHRTLMENIRYARPKATDREVIAAAKLAHCHEFISKFSEGYNTFVGERGVKLSGGERQRVAIARAILKDAPILVLDEATSSLDSESEKLIQDALKTLMKGKTSIVIAHRLSTIMQMDRIVVLQNGAIIEEGKHAELVKAKQGMYQKLWEIQAGGFS